MWAMILSFLFIASLEKMVKWNCLKELSLSWNGLADTGFIALASGMTKDRSEITCLDVSFNRITEKSKTLFTF